MGTERLTHALVVGGTGMLRGVSLALARRGHAVTVVARNQTRLRALREEALPGTVEPLALDLRHTARLESALARASSKQGTIGLAVVWVHGDAPEAPLVVARFILGDYFHVLGSAAADPSHEDENRTSAFAAYPQVRYHEIILGFVAGERRSRWLTNEEIGRGVLTAIENGSRRHIVGTVKPWSAKP